MAFGTFDIFHPGHLHYLREAAAVGDYLIVVVGRDSVVKRLYNKEPTFSQEERAALVAALEVVDEATLGYDVTSWDEYERVLREYDPDVVMLGYDMKVREEEVRKMIREAGITTEVRRASEYQPDSYKSSLLN